MSNKSLAQTLFSALYEPALLWSAKNYPFQFYTNDEGWTWVSNNSQLYNQAFCSNLQQSGFVSRKAAAQYLDAVLGTDIEKGGFWRGNITNYVVKGYEFQIFSYDGDWLVHHPHHGYIKNNINILRFKTRKAAIAFMIENRCEYLK